MLSKYQIAMNVVRERPKMSGFSSQNTDDIHLSILQELVEKAVPKKPIKKYYTTPYGNHGKKKRLDIRCSCCNSSFTNGARTSIGVFKSKEKEFIKTINNQKFCRFCSQAIDWSDEND